MLRGQLGAGCWNRGAAVRQAQGGGDPRGVWQAARASVTVSSSTPSRCCSSLLWSSRSGRRIPATSTIITPFVASDLPWLAQCLVPRAGGVAHSSWLSTTAPRQDHTQCPGMISKSDAKFGAYLRRGGRAAGLASSPWPAVHTATVLYCVTYRGDGWKCANVAWARERCHSVSSTIYTRLFRIRARLRRDALLR